MAQAPDTVDIFVDLADVNDYPDAPDVGTVYEVGINGVGFMLAVNPEGGPAWERGSIPLLPERLATTDTPFSQSVNRYTFAANSEFEGGEGEDFANRSESDPKKFKDGERIDPFGNGAVTVGPAAVEERDTTYVSTRMAVVGDKLYVQAGDDDLDHASVKASWTSLAGITDGGPITIYDLTSDGSQWYAATKTSVIRGTTTDPAAAWSTVDAWAVQWAAGRICAAVEGATSATPNEFHTLIDAGTSDFSFVLPDGQTIQLGGTAGGHYYFAGTAGVHGSIFAWKLGVNEAAAFFTPYEAWKLPAGSTLVDVSTAGGSVWIQLLEGATDDLVLYRGIPNDQGQLTVIRVADITPGETIVQSNVVEWNGKVFLTWPDHGTGPGVAAVDLASGGFAKYSGEMGTGQLRDLTVWNGELVACDDDGKVWILGTVPAATGVLTTPIVDGASSLDKVWDDVTLVFEPLLADESIDVEYTSDGGSSFTALGTVDTDGATRYQFALGIKAASLGLRITLNSSSTTAPTLQSAMLRLHPLGLIDGVLVLPIVSADRLKGLNGQVIDGKPGSGSAQARALEALAGSRVRVQDIDWKDVGSAEIYEVLQTQSSAHWLQNKNKPQLQYVTTMTLRKTVSGYVS